MKYLTLILVITFFIYLPFASDGIVLDQAPIVPTPTATVFVTPHAPTATPVRP